MSKDLNSKMLMRYEDVFCDIMNVLVFNGKQIIKETELYDQETSEFYYIGDNIKGIQRDISKKWIKENIQLSCLCIENQTNTDQDMPLRMMGYDGVLYRDELNNDNKDRYPVLSLVLYFGYTRWNTSKCLHECFEIDKSMEQFINNYKINLVEIAFLSDEQIEMFQSDFKMIAQYFSQKQKYEDYHPSNQDLKHIYETLNLLSTFSGDKRFIEAYTNTNNDDEGEPRNMCEILDRIENRGYERGMQIRIEKEKKIILKLSKKLSIDEISECFEMPKEEIQSILQSN